MAIRKNNIVKSLASLRLKQVPASTGMAGMSAKKPMPRVSRPMPKLGTIAKVASAARKVRSTKRKMLSPKLFSPRKK